MLSLRQMEEAGEELPAKSPNGSAFPFVPPFFLLYLLIFFLLVGFRRCLELGDVRTSKTQASSVLILGNRSGVDVNPRSSNIQNL